MPDSGPNLRYGFQTKVLISVIGIMVLLQLITTGLVNRRLSSQFESEAARAVVNADTLFKNSQQVRAKNLLLRYRNVPNEPRFKAVFQLADAKTSGFLLEELLEELGGTLIVFTTDSGQRLAVASQDPLLEADQEFESRSAASIQRALAGEPTVDIIGVGPRLFEAVSIPVRIGDRISGALTFGMELDDAVAQELKQLADCELVFLSGNRMAASTLPAASLGQQNGAEAGQWSDPTDIANHSHGKASRQIIINGEHFIYSIGRLGSLSGDSGLRYMLLASYEKPLQMLEATQRMLVLALLFGLLLSSIVLSVLIRKLTRPLRLMRESAEAVGRGDFSQHVPVLARDEFGELAAGFNKMTANLQNSREQLEESVGALRISENFLSSLVESLPQNIYRKDVAGRFTFVNGLLCRTLGKSRDQIIGKTYADVFPAELAAKLEEEDRRILVDHKPLETEEEQQTPEGGKTHLHFAKTPLYDSAGQAVGVQGMFWDVTERKRAEADKAIQEARLEMSRLSGMAEVATGILHNVGNVLNSVNVSATLVAENMRQSKAANLGKVVALLGQHAADLGTFMTSDPKGKQLPGYLRQLADHLTNEQQSAVTELDSLRKNIEHIKDIVSMQQSYAKVSGVSETVNVTDLLEDTLRMNASALLRHEVQIIREYDPHLSYITTEKHKVLQILVNLVHNAKYACDESGRKEKRVTLRSTNGRGRVKITVADNGVGIPPENLTRIFNHGFTTRKDGHGFGLHSGALAARELGGSLTAHSDGCGLGATFTLELPVQSMTTPA